MELGLSGLASGFDWRTLVDQLTDVERTPQNRLRVEQNQIQQRKTAYSALQTQLAALQTRVDALKEASLFNSRTTKVGDSTIASAAATGSAAVGTYTFNFTQLATAARQQGSANVGTPLSATNDVSGVVLSSAGFANPITPGTFTVSGKQITIETSDTLQAVFDKISTATSGAVTGSYDSATDRITLNSASPIVLGSGTDTSNFLLAAKLNNNGTGTVTSSSSLGSVRLSAPLASGNFTTSVSDGGSGAGKFKINGVEITFNATSDSTSNVIDRINSSNAGVIAGYDSVNDRFTLTNRSTGDVGVALEDVTGNFLAASGLLGGTLDRGKDLLYTINGGATLNSRSNTIDQSSSGLAGLTVTALKQGASTTVEIASDTAKIKTAINDFITEYNKTQTLIDTQTASSTDAKGQVTAGVLADANDATDIATELRHRAYAQLTSLSGSIKNLEQLGISTSGTDNNLTLSDSTKLDAALASNLSSVQDFFSHSTNGLAVSLSSYLDATIGEDGSLISRQDTLTSQSSSIDTSIADMERQVLANRQRLIDSFVTMETAQAKINQQLQFLQRRFGGG